MEKIFGIQMIPRMTMERESCGKSIIFADAVMLLVVVF